MSGRRHVFPILWQRSRRLGFNRRARFLSAQHIAGWVVSSSPVKNQTPIREKRYGSYRWLRTRSRWRWTMPSIFRRHGGPRDALDISLTPPVVKFLLLALRAL